LSTSRTENLAGSGGGGGGSRRGGAALRYFDGANPVEAATAASERTAGYCATRQTGQVAVRPLLEFAAPSVDTISNPPTVYVAASHHTPEQRWSARTVAHGIDDVGGRSLYPLRDIGPVRDQAVTAGADLEALAACGSVLVLADLARAGPFFEAGWATHAGIPVVVASSDVDPTRFTMLRGSGATVTNDLTTAVYNSVWWAMGHLRKPDWP
jgi:nucleoside 2-deoxyribosyltransferase